MSRPSTSRMIDHLPFYAFVDPKKPASTSGKNNVKFEYNKVNWSSYNQQYFSKPESFFFSSLIFNIMQLPDQSKCIYFNKFMSLIRWKSCAFRL